MLDILYNITSKRDTPIERASSKYCWLMRSNGIKNVPEIIIQVIGIIRNIQKRLKKVKKEIEIER